MLNVFTENSKRGKRGRPPGRTPEGEAARSRLYAIAVDLIAERGYEETTLRDVAARAGVSAGLLYRYFPSKRSIVLALYDELSERYAREASGLPPGKWRDRFSVALETSRKVLAPHRVTLRALVPVMVGDVEEGVFAQSTAFSRMRVQAVFQRAIAEATDAPPAKLAEALARVLYLVHLGVLLWWLLDKSPKQRATDGLLALFRRVLPPLALTLRLPMVRGFVQAADELLTDALLGPADSTGGTSRA
jgi:AcrR family transcriptional regulator